MEPLPISLPFDYPEGASARVYVIPDKLYNQIPGRELFNLYGINNQKREQKSHFYIHWITEDDNFFVFGNILKGNISTFLNLYKPIDVAKIITIIFPPDELPQKIQIGKHSYVFRDVIHIVEDILDIKIICRYNNRCIKKMINASLEVTLQPVDKGIIIFGKKGYSYLLKRE